MVLGAAFKAERMFHLMDDLPDNYKKRLESLTEQHQAFIRNVSTDDLISMARNASVNGVSFFQANEGYTVYARGVFLPNLLHEAVKGLLGIVACAGLPKDRELQGTVLKYADTVENEMLGAQDVPRLWQLALDKAKQEKVNPAVAFRKIVELPAEEFIAFCKTDEVRLPLSFG